MQLVDTHCHLDFPDYENDLADIIEKAASAGVDRIIVPGTSASSSEAAVRLAGSHPGVFAAAGIHPHEADRTGPDDIARIRELALDNDKIVAVGEIGLDQYKGYSKIENQIGLFRDCLQVAWELDLPVILHNRNAEKHMLDILRKDHLFELKGVVHCFSGGRDFLKEILFLDFYVSFAGNITFEKASELRALAKEVPPDRLLLETDGPYLTPVPFRGKRNEPAYVKYLLDIYAEIYGFSREDVARITTHNANKLFRLGLKKKGVATYRIRESLYINITHRCTNRCAFCARENTDYVKGYNLRLDAEPTTGEIIDSLGDVTKYKEIVFCGFGEPTLRIGALKRVAGHIKKDGGKVRLVTNGEADLIRGRSVAGELAGLVDNVSVSINAPDRETYQHNCRSIFGNKAYDAIIDFIKECVAHGIDVELTCLDFIGEEAVAKVCSLAESCGATFRLRHLHVVG